MVQGIGHRRVGSFAGNERGVFHHSQENDGDPDVENRADDQRTDDADGKITLRIFGFLRRGRDGIEADVSEKDDGAAGDDSGEARGSERLPVGGMDEHAADDQKREDRADLHGHDHVIGFGGFSDSTHEQYGQEENDEERRNIEDRAGPMSRFPDRAGPAIRQVHSKRGELRFGVGAEADRDDDIADGVFENQIPADDPGEDFAQRGVGIGIGAAGDGDHGGQLRVTKTGKTTGQRDEKKRNRDSGSSRGAPVHEHGGGTAMAEIIDEQVEDLGVQDGGGLEIFSGGSGSGENKNSRADDSADTQCREGPGAEGLFQPVLRSFGLSD